MKRKPFLALPFLVILFCFLLSTPSLALELVEGMTWSYINKVNGQLFCLNRITVTGWEETEAGIIWTVKGEYFYKAILEKNVQEYRGELLIRLGDDYTLVSAEDTTGLNGENLLSISIGKTEDGYGFSKTERGAQESKEIRTDEPLYLYDAAHPWLTELLLSAQILTPEKACRAITLTGELITITPQDPSGQNQAEAGTRLYLAHHDRIYVKAESTVTRIDTENHGMVEFVSGEDFSEAQIPGFDLGHVVQDLPSNIPLLHPPLLTGMIVSIKVRPFFLDLTYLQTPTGRQQFTGTINEQWVEGHVNLKQEGERIPAAKEAFPFPVAIDWEPELAGYLSDHPFLQINHPEINAAAKVITKTAPNTWAAAVAIARWVGENVTYDPALTGKELKAGEILQERKGVCGHFALLTVALCRALKIPARFISGYAYSRSDNCFKLHAWVEVWDSKSGWRAMDPTWGQYETVNLTHIGFSDQIALAYTLTVTGLNPGTIEILHFTPEEAGPMAPPPLPPDLFPARRKEWRYEVFSAGQKAGTYTAKFSAADDGNYRLTEEFAFPASEIKYQAELFLTEQGYVLSYRNEGLWNGEKRKREFFFGKNLQIRAVHNNEEIHIETFRTQKDEITVDVFSFIQWWLLAARLVGGVETATTKTVTVFVVDRAEYRNLVATVKPYPVEAGTNRVGWHCRISGAQFRMELYLNEEKELIGIDIPEAHLSAVLVEF